MTSINAYPSFGKTETETEGLVYMYVCDYQHLYDPFVIKPMIPTFIAFPLVQHSRVASPTMQNFGDFYLFATTGWLLSTIAKTNGVSTIILRILQTDDANSPKQQNITFHLDKQPLLHSAGVLARCFSTKWSLAP